MAERHAADDEGGELGAGLPPLLFGVAADELFEDVAPCELEPLFFEVFRLADVELFDLAGDLSLRLFGRDDPPQLREGVHVEGQVVKLVPIARDGRIDEVVEADKAVDIVPDMLVARMEDVRAVAVDVDAIQPLGVGVAADVRPSFDDEAPLPRLVCFVGEHAAEEPRPHDEIVVLRHS